MSILLIGSMSQKNSHFVEGLYYITFMGRLLRQFYFGWRGQRRFMKGEKLWGEHRLLLLLLMLVLEVGHELPLSSFVFLDQY